MKKKVLSALLTAGMVVTMLAGCGNSGNSGNASVEQNRTASTESTASTETAVINMDEDPYEVAIQIVVLPGTEVGNESELEDAINEITLPAINCTVDLQFVWISEIANTTSLAVAGNEKIDLIHVGTVQPLSSMVGSDILYDMNTDNLLQTHGQALVALFGDKIASGQVGGRQLAVPARQYTAVKKGFYYNKTIADKLGITVPESGTLDDFEKVLYEVKASGEDIMCHFVGGGDMNLMAWMQPYEAFGTEAAYGAVMDSSKSMTVENLYATEDYKNYILRMYKWRQDGIIEKDATDTSSSTDYQYAQQLFCGQGDYTPEQMINNQVSAAQNGFEYGYMTLVDANITNSSVTEYMWGIATNSERPDKAMDFLNFLYSNADVANIIKYGIEGENYTMAEGSDDIIETNGTYMPMFYQGGDLSKMYIKAPAGEDYIDQCEAQEASANVSPLLGYMFDDTEFQTESAVISSVIKQYTPTLQNGLCGSEEQTLAYLDEFISSLEAAGINDVIAANQEQLDAWLAEK